MRPALDDLPPPMKVRTTTVMVVCVVKEDGPSYLVGGVRQKAGDRARVTIDVALTLEKQGKARIVPDTEKGELL